MMDHSKRTHALLSPSAAHRWANCTPSAKLEDTLPDTTSEAAAEGTLAHEICETKLRFHFFTTEFGRKDYNARMKELKAHELYKAEMMGYTDDYKDFVHKEALKFEHKPHVVIERRLDLNNYVPESFGTADCILIGGNTLHVIDFKYGKGVPVSADHNEQLALYALGVYEEFSIIYDIKTVKMSIVQPRIDNNSTWEIPIETLLTFGEDIREKARLAFNGEGEFKTGDWCKFCRASHSCRARADENIRLAFATDKKPDLLTNEEIGEYLRIGQDVAAWLKDLQEYALGESLAGRPVAGWKAVEGRGSREWIDQDKAFSILKENGFDEAVLYVRNPITLAQTETLVGKKDFKSLVGDLVKKNPGKPTLVKESDKRQAITNKVTASEAFKEE